MLSGYPIHFNGGKPPLLSRSMRIDFNKFRFRKRLWKEKKITNKRNIKLMNLNNTNLNLNNLIQSEVDRISTKYNKDFLDCEDLIKITGLGRDNVRNLLRSKSFPTTKVGKRQVVSVLNFVTWLTLNNNQSEASNG